MMEERSGYNIKPVSPEISKKDKMAQASIFQVNVLTMKEILGFGLHTEDSIAAAITKLAEEHLNIELVALTAEEREQRMAEAQAQAMQMEQQKQALKAAPQEGATEA